MTDAPVNIFLEGKLGKLFGRKWELFVSSPAEAIRAIDANLKGKLKKYLTNEGAKKYYKIAIQKKDNLIGAEEIKNPSGCGDIYFIPTIKGHDGVTQIVAGIVIIIVSLVLDYFTWGGFTSATGGYSYQLGIGLILGGVVQLLTPVPKGATSKDDDENRKSFIFGGNVGAINQGTPIGIIYGRTLVAPMPIMITVETQDIPIAPVTIGTATQPENINFNFGFIGK
jgi:predicted phage tail protein